MPSDLPPSVYQLLETIDDAPSKQLRYGDIAEKHLRDALDIALFHKLVQTFKPQSLSLPNVLPANRSTEAKERWAKLAAAYTHDIANPIHLLTDKGAYIDTLARSVTGKLGGKVGIAPAEEPFQRFQCWAFSVSTRRR
jgi:hypothetical protein